MPKAQETVLEIDLNALKHNFDHLKSKLNSTTKFLGVVKAFSYGNEANEIAKFLQELGIDYFAVAYAKEGAALREAGVTKPILVLHPQSINFESLIDNCLEPSIYSFRILQEFMAITSEKGLEDYPVHIKFNTGLNRLGFWHSDVELLIETLLSAKNIKVKSIFSHLAASEDLTEDEFSKNQISTFKKISEHFNKLIGYSPIMHMCNTSGILNYPEAQFDMVRSGIGLYGFGNSEIESQFLKPIATLKTIISQIHKIENGESVGYNRAYKSDRPLTTATLPIGHADGLSRIYGNGKGYVNIHGKKAAIIGNTCMDMVMVDITGIDCNEGDEVIIFGPDNSAEDLAGSAGTISYELITGISQRVKRKILK